MRKDFINVVSTLVGSIIGAGIFGIPYVFAQAGFLISAILFLILVFVMLLLHLMYAEVIERTSERHRLVGYVNFYIGTTAKKLISISVIVGAYGAFLAYILLANDFLNILFGRLFSGEILWGFIFWGVLSVGVIKGIKTIAKIEVFMLGLLIVVFILIALNSMPHFEVSNLAYINLNNFFVPYGVILFAIFGFQAIPELRSMIKKKDGKMFRNAIITGTLFAALITFLFGVIILGVSGKETSEYAIAGLRPIIGNGVVYIGALFGIMAIGTSYLVFGINLKESLMYDWKLPEFVSIILAVFIPIIFLFLGVRNFIGVIAVLGAFFGAINGSMIAFLFIKARKHGDTKPSFTISVPKILIYAIIFALVVGGIYEMINVIKF